MSTSIIKVLWGAVLKLVAILSAEIFLNPVRGSISFVFGRSPFLSSMNFLTSSSDILPSGPLPLTNDKFMPCSFARRFAAGEAITLFLESWANWGFSARISCSVRVSSGAVIIAKTALTGASAPSSISIFLRIPVAGDSRSYVAFSEIISTIGSPFLTVSPSFLYHWPMVPSFIVRLSFGITTFVTI